MTVSGLSKTDVRILRELQKDGRISNVDLAEKVGMAPSPCLRRVKALQEKGMIDGYTARLNRKKLGLGVQAVCMVKLHDHAEEAVAQFVEAVTAMPEVTACYSMTGRSDFMLMIYATDLENYGRIATHRLLRLPNVQDVESGLVLEVLKGDSGLPLNHLSPAG
ncbi:Lrp/AsnC family transcriptional regulator [Aestuariispira insulae]|uniref:AsnC family transcriptional regulator n=1 Tax=Aestuariispira insulae TaxID=1461337 RepID=A0A3D9HI79_9PROT|nr:Lrp/AsnC family transcriptional regulator [Aestuariispira insulae]RED49229.1 AsnC family transcriptional regulator [Aestuariispira insulae]